MKVREQEFVPLFAVKPTTKQRFAFRTFGVSPDESMNMPNINSILRFKSLIANNISFHYKPSLEPD